MPCISTGIDKPSYMSLKQFQDKLDENMLAVPNPTDTLGYLGLFITANEYTTLSDGIDFNIPEGPGVAPPHANTYANRTTAERAICPFLVQEGIQTFYGKKNVQQTHGNKRSSAQNNIQQCRQQIH